MKVSEVEVVIDNIVKILDAKGMSESASVLCHIKNRLQVAVTGDLDFSSVDKLMFENHIVAILG